MDHSLMSIAELPVIITFEAGIASQEKVRIDMLKRFGYFSTESNGHLSKYVPWYHKRVDEILKLKYFS